MTDLDLWSEATVIGPLSSANPKAAVEWDPAVEQVKKAIRAKVLESYRNGRNAPNRPEQPPRGNGGRYGR